MAQVNINQTNGWPGWGRATLGGDVISHLNAKLFNKNKHFMTIQPFCALLNQASRG